MLTHIWQRTLVWRSWDPNKISAKKLKARKKQAEVWFVKVTQPERKGAVIQRGQLSDPCDAHQVGWRETGQKGAQKPWWRLLLPHSKSNCQGTGLGTLHALSPSLPSPLPLATTVCSLCL